MALKFHEFVNISDHLTTFLEKMLAPYVEDRVQSTEAALELLHRPADTAYPPAQEQSARSAGIEFSRPEGDRPGSLSALVHEVSKHSNQAATRLRQQAFRSTDDKPRQVERPDKMRSQVESSTEALRIQVGTPPFSLIILFWLVVLAAFSGLGFWMMTQEAVVLGLLFNLCAALFFSFVYFSHKKVDLRIDDRGLHYREKLAHRSKEMTISLDAISQVSLDLHMSSGSGRSQKNHYRIVVQTHQKPLRFGTFLSRPELEYLAYIIDKEIEERRAAQQLPSGESPDNLQEQIEHQQYHHEQVS